MTHHALCAVCVGLALGTVAPNVAAQDAPQPVVHITQYQVPWDRVDSLRVLSRMYPERIALAKEDGHILDRKVLVHMQGDEWNVLIVTVFPSWDAFTNPEPGWGQAIFRRVEPDSTRRAAFNAGLNWVYRGTIHKDNIYRQVRP